MIFSYIDNFLLIIHLFLQKLFVALGPSTHGQFCNINTIILIHGRFPLNVIPIFPIKTDFSLEILIKRVNRSEFFIFQKFFTNHLGQLPGIKIGNRCGPAGTDALRTVHQTHGNNRVVALRFHHLAVIFEIFQAMVIVFHEDSARYSVQVGENVSRRSMIFSSHIPGSELPDGHEKINVIGAHKVLSQRNDRHSERHFAVVVSCMFGHVTLQLSHFDFLSQVALETSEQNFALARLQAVHDIGDGSLVGVDSEMDHFFVDEVLIGDIGLIVIQNVIGVGIGQPFFSQIGVGAFEEKFNGLVVFRTLINKHFAVLGNGLEVLHGFSVGGGTQTFVVLHFPTSDVIVLLKSFEIL